MRKALEEALVRRAPIKTALEREGTTACRLFCGEREGIPGLIVDNYGGVGVLQWYEDRCALTDGDLKSAADFLVGRLGITAVYLKRFLSDRSHALAGKDMYEATPLAGEPSLPEVTVREHGVSFLIHPYEGFSTGLFLDQRENRRRLAELSAGKEVLNGFSYTCGFSVAASLKGGRVTSVDVSKKYLEWGKRNFVANDLDPSDYCFVVEDVLKFLMRAEKKGRSFDLVILDPPTFGRSERGVFSLEKDFGKLLGLALKVVRPGGKLFFSSNYAGWDTATLRRLAAREMEVRPGWTFEPLPDVPPDFAWQTHPLSAFLAQLP